MTSSRLIAVFTALTLVSTPLQASASEELSDPSFTSSTVAIALPLLETPSSTEPSPDVDLTQLPPPTTIDLTSPTASSSETYVAPPDSAATSTHTLVSTEFETPLEPISSTSTTSTICLAIIAPYPAEGSEWIAMYGLTPSSSHRVLQWSIHDAQSSLIKITSSTPLLWDEPTKTLRYSLRSARLNNDGDTVTLKNDLGEMHDTFTYTDVERDQRWYREGCDTPWRIIPEPVIEYVSDSSRESIPDAGTASTNNEPIALVQEPLMNVTPEALPESTPIIIEEERPEDTHSNPVPEPLRNVEPKPPVGVVATTRAVMPPTPITTASTAEHIAKAPSSTSSSKNTSAKLTTTSKNVPAKKKTSTSSAKTPKRTVSKPSVKAPPLSPTMSALLQQPAEYQGIRVRITGMVASTRKLIGAHKFVLLNSDGKGLLVHAKTTSPSPERGQHIQLTGVITWNDEGVWLKQQAQDTWELTTRDADDVHAEFALHPASLDEPGQEDAWSHIEVEGKVTEVQSGSFDIETEDGIPLRIRLPKLLGYRAGRLESRDTVRVRGLLDTRGTEPVLLPQVIEDIQIIERAPLPAQQEPRPAQAPWLPVGVVAGTLAASETFRRAKTWYKKQQEERAFATYLQTDPQNIH